MLKNILSLLLSKFYSKQESELVGHQAMPSSTWTAISLSQTTSDSWTPIGSYTAPNDGYIQLQGEATADASQLAIRTENNGEVRGSFICRTFISCRNSHRFFRFMGFFRVNQHCTQDSRALIRPLASSDTCFLNCKGLR